MQVRDELRARTRAELPEVEEIAGSELRDKVVEARATALAPSSFERIADIPPSGNPGARALKKGTLTDHIRGVARLAMRICDELSDMFPDLEVNRDVLIAGALCHDVGKPWEFDPRNQERWQGSPRAATLPTACTSASPSTCRRRWRTSPAAIPARVS